MAKHVIVGAGSIGKATANLLADAGEQVTLVSRSGGDDLLGVRRVRLDATDGAAIAEVATGAVALYNCMNPAYQRWTTDWPPLAAAMLSAAERSGAVLATVSNLYGYGAVNGPMTEATPLAPNSRKGRVRAQMWLDTLAAHQAGRIRMTEIRGGDYIAAGAQSRLGDRVIPKLLAGKKVQVMHGADTPHTWTYTMDVATLLVKVAADERAWGKPWHVPSNPPRSQREAVGDFARVAGVAPVKVSEMPAAMLKVLGLFMPIVRELHEVAYQFDKPFVLDSSQAQETFGLAPTPWDDVLKATVASYL